MKNDLIEERIEAHRKHNLPIQKKNERITRYMLTKNGKRIDNIKIR